MADLDDGGAGPVTFSEAVTALTNGAIIERRAFDRFSEIELGGIRRLRRGRTSIEICFPGNEWYSHVVTTDDLDATWQIIKPAQ